MITLTKKTGINLKKGSSIRLEKDGVGLRKVCVGLNWGAIEKKSFLGGLVGGGVEEVDLDGAVSLFSRNEASETIYYHKLASDNGAVQHSGDDLTGDLNGDDGLDNEIITIDLTKVEDHIDTIFIYLNSYQGQDFGKIPYSKLRIFEGTQDYVDDVLATFNLSVEEKFKGYVSMIMGKLMKVGNAWSFVAIGDPIPPRSIGNIVSHISDYYISKKAI